MSLVAAADPQQVHRMVDMTDAATPAAPVRTSTLAAPTMQLQGHDGAVNCAQFSRDGALLATGGQDREIFLWDAARPELPNIAVLNGHRGHVLQLAWGVDATTLASASSDKTAALWDAEAGRRTQVWKHKGYVNGVAATSRGRMMALTACDDKVCRLWEQGSNEAAVSVSCGYPQLAVAVAADGSRLYTAGVDEVIRAWDVRKPSAALYTLQGHTDTITGLALSPDGTQLLSNAMDNTLRTWDVRAFTTNTSGRAVGAYGSHVHDKQVQGLLRCSYSPDGSQLTAGSSDGVVHVWDRATYVLRHSLHGHRAAVNDVAWHPTMPVLASASDDKTVVVGEL